jgi:hypothetical protein
MVAVALGLLAGYVHDTLSDSDEFADRAVITLAAPEVRERITDAVVDQIVAADAELVSVQPLLESILDGALRSDTTETLVRASVVDLHRTVLGQDDDTVTMQLADLILVAKTQLTALDPEAGALIPDDLTDAIVEISTEPVFVDAIQRVDDLRWLAVLLPLVAALMFAGAVWSAATASEAMVRVGLAIVGGALLAALVERLCRALVIPDGAASADVARSVWDAFANELTTWTILTAGIGGVIAAVAWFGVGETDPRPAVGRLAEVIRPRGSPSRRIVWGLASAAIGLVLIIEWRMTVQFGVTVVGAALVAAGLREVVAVAAPGLVHGASAAAAEHAEPHERDGAGWGRWVSMALLLVGGVVAMAAVSQGADGAQEGDDRACNGDRRLCERRLDEVVFAATHNSHAAADDGFLLGYQRHGISSQLEDGIRGLLIDVYFGRDVDGSVITDRAPLTDDERDELVVQIGEAAVRSAEATAVRADESGVERELFLCHALCEIGASRFDVELGGMARFLADNPREVLVLIIQDEGPRPSDIAEAFDSAGLIDRLHAQPLDAPWPTLGDLIEADTPVVVFAENVAGEFDWYHDAFAYTQDTPFSFETAEDFSCDLNRGDTDNALFLVNHWLSPASPTSADEVNDAAVVEGRFEACGDERGQMPNLIAVDFYSRGDIVETVAELNDS